MLWWKSSKWSSSWVETVTKQKIKCLTKSDEPNVYTLSDTFSYVTMPPGGGMLWWKSSK